jgi:hypothetical protein
MDTAGTSSEQPVVSTLPDAAPVRRSGWSEVLASLVLSAATFEMLVLHGIVHWDIMFRWRPEAPEQRDAVFTVLDHLSVLRLVFAVLALVWAIWSFRRAPRWAAWVAVGVSVIALGTNAVLM